MTTKTTKTEAALEAATLAYEAACSANSKARADLGRVLRARWTLSQGEALRTFAEDQLIDIARVKVAEKAFYLSHPVLVEVAYEVAKAAVTKTEAAEEAAIDAVEAAEKAHEKAEARRAKRRAA